MRRLMHEGRWGDERVQDEAKFDPKPTPADDAAAAARTPSDEDRWPLLHTDDGMATLINETVGTPGGIEALAIVMAALMRAPAECHGIAIQDLRDELVRRADQYLDTPSLLRAQA